MTWLDSFLGETHSTHTDTRDSLSDLAHDIGRDAISHGDISTATESASAEASLSSDSWE